MLLTLLIASTIGTAAPAREPVAPATVTIEAVAVTSPLGAHPAAPSATTRYCVVDQLTGSHIPTRLCRTASEWIATEGAVPTGRIKRR